MAYRISFTGAQGTGKSTLAAAIAARLRADGFADVQFYGGVGVAVAHAGLATGAAAGADAVRAFAHLHREREARAAGAVQVFDRCLLDTLAYARVLDCFAAAEFDALRTAARDSSRRFDQLVWLRVTQDYPVNSANDETAEFRRAIDAAIGQLAEENGIALVQHALPPEEIDDVVAAVTARFNTARGRP